MKPDKYLIEIKEGTPSLSSSEYSTCRTCHTCRSPGGRYEVTWTILLLARCSGGCGCRLLISHLAAVHDSSGIGDWAGTYTTPAEIDDPALRRYAEALLMEVQPPPASQRSAEPHRSLVSATAGADQSHPAGTGGPSC
ncbi:hypothetical protein OG339_48075 (plasmid) [Streptosporangium sp. NBC_01495]|uniref:hypothetical protein n=1 Tax=Streptosporangium sp. NBC_01495 TaxID=2903899 RepID=UPI002E2EFF20|nr:hypothetical protein [Streptosporangium sp. NBC_01495]